MSNYLSEIFVKSGESQDGRSGARELTFEIGSLPVISGGLEHNVRGVYQTDISRRVYLLSLESAFKDPKNDIN